MTFDQDEDPIKGSSLDTIGRDYGKRYKVQLLSLSYPKVPDPNCRSDLVQKSLLSSFAVDATRQFLRLAQDIDASVR